MYCVREREAAVEVITDKTGRVKFNLSVESGTPDGRRHHYKAASHEYCSFENSAPVLTMKALPTMACPGSLTWVRLVKRGEWYTVKCKDGSFSRLPLPANGGRIDQLLWLPRLDYQASGGNLE